MKKRRVTTHQAKTHLSQLLVDVENGEEILVCRGQHVIARLVSARDATSPKRPKVGTISSGPVKISRGAFTPLSGDDLKDWGL